MENPNLFVREDIINELTKDSMESYIKKVQELAYSNVKRIVGEDSTARVNLISTFKNYALVADQNSKVYRLNIKNENGELSLVKSERIDEVKVYTDEQLQKISEIKLSNTLKSVLEGASGDIELRESFDEMLSFKSSGQLDGYINLNNNK